LLPCGFAAERARLGECKIRELEPEEEFFLLRGSCEQAGWETEVMFRADGGESVGELGQGERVFGSDDLELGVEGGWNKKGFGEQRGHGFGGREGEVAGLGGGRVHGIRSELNDTRVKGRGGVGIVFRDAIRS
jgi:hypothetical protein